MAIPDFSKLLKPKLLSRAPQKMEPFAGGSVFPDVPGWTFAGNSPSLLYFMSMSCTACIRMLPGVKTFAKAYEGRFVLVTNAYAEEAEALVEHYGFEFPVLRLEDEEFYLKYRIIATPYAYAVDASGIVIGGDIVKGMDVLRALAQEQSHRG